MPTLSRDDVSLYFERVDGRAPAVVLIHGWCCDRTYFAPQVEHFARQGRAVVALDLRGHGQSDKPEQAYTMPAFADDVAWVCRQLALVRPVLVGHSMGGTIAFDVAARYPSLPGAIAMLDSAVILPEAARAGIPKLLEALESPGYAAALKDFLGRALFLPTDDAARKARIIAGMTSAPQHMMVAAYRGLAEYDAAAVAKDLVAPSLYVAGNEASPRCDTARLRALLPAMLQGQTVGSGHFLQLEVPEQINAMLDRFLAIALPASE